VCVNFVFDWTVVLIIGSKWWSVSYVEFIWIWSYSQVSLFQFTTLLIKDKIVIKVIWQCCYMYLLGLHIIKQFNCRKFWWKVVNGTYARWYLFHINKKNGHSAAIIGSHMSKSMYVETLLYSSIAWEAKWQVC